MDNIEEMKKLNNETLNKMNKIIQKQMQEEAKAMSKYIDGINHVLQQHLIDISKTNTKVFISYIVLSSCFVILSLLLAILAIFLLSI